MEKSPRYDRDPKAIGNMVIQPRDAEIVKLVWDYRFLSSEYIQKLVDGSDQVILRRLQKLYHHGYLDRPLSQIVFSNPLLGPKKMVYGLGDRGADLLSEEYGIDRGKIAWREKNREVSERYIQHTLMVSEFRVCLTLALRDRPGLKLKWLNGCGTEFRESVYIPESVNYTQVPAKKKRLSVIPDGYFSIKDSDGTMHFFLEADRSTMTNSRYLSKMRAYWLFCKQGRTRELGFEHFRVLTITKTSQRRENLAQTTQKAFSDPQGHYMFWFASQKDFSFSNYSSILDNIWVTANTTSGELHSLLE
jgi:hypothetical protein